MQMKTAFLSGAGRAAGLAGLLGLFAPVESQAATFVVDRIDDTNVAAAQVCSAAANDCSLRGAITKANNIPGADVITFDPITNGAPFTLTLANAGGLNEDGNATGDLDVLASGGGLTITGNGSSLTVIQAGTNATNGIDKVLALNPICNVAAAFAISNVTIRFGRNTQAYGGGDFGFTGGGLDFCGTGNAGSSFALSNSVVTQNTNTDGYGGGINIDEVAPATSVVTITNTVISANTSRYHGGGINVFGDNAQVTITGSAIFGNNTLGTAGAGAQGGGASIRITNQNDGDGAAVPFVAMNGTPVTNNVGVGFGGGVDAAGSGNQNLTISNGAITGNSLIVVAGGVTDTTGGGLDHSNTAGRTTTLTNVLIANNLSAGSASSTAGGVSNQAANLVLRNTTISGNSARLDGGGLRSVGAGASTTLTNSTISNNRSDSDNNASGTGGGIRVSAGTVTLENTIVAGNFTGTGSTVNEINGSVTANFSLIGSVTGATIGGASNQLGASARLAALANNGAQTVGPTGFTAVLQTHAPGAGSPALDSGSNPLSSAAGLTTDQRGTGYARVLDAADLDVTDETDIGAHETHPSVEDAVDAAINEDGSYVVTINLGDADLAFDAVTASSSNTTLVPNSPGNISLSGSGSSRTLTINPAANVIGSTTITLTVTDTVNSTSHSMTDTFVLTVNPIADTPSGTNATTSEDTQTASGLVLSRNVADGAEVTHFGITGITNGTLFLADGTTPVPNGSFITSAQGNAGLKFTPALNLFSPGSSFGFNVTAALNGAGAGLSPATSIAVIVNPVAETPGATGAATNEDTQTSGGLVVSRNAADGAEVTHFRITAITSGTLFLNDGSTPVANNAFITFAEANAGLRFTPAANLASPATTFSFSVAGATSNAGAGLGPATTASITVTPVADTPSVTSAATNEDTQTAGGLVISRNAVDGTEVTHFRITGITNGTLFLNDGLTPVVNNAFITSAQGNAGLKFTPAADLFSPGTSFSFDASAATSNAGAGLSPAATASILVSSVNDPPTVVNPIPDQSATEASVFTFTFAADTFADVDPGSAFTYSATGVPAWLTFTPATRTFTGTPANADVGPVDVTVIATDNGTPSTANVSDTFKITVANVDFAPTVTSPTSSSITGTTATLGGDVTSDGGSVITERGVVYSETATNNDPLIGGTGVTKVPVIGATGLFATGVTGLAPTTGHSFKAFATNAIGTTYTSVATFTTTCPVITLASLPNGNADTNYTGSAAASGGTGPYTYAVTSGALPGGLSLTASGAGAGNVGGTPTTTGTFTFDITATDTSGTGACTGVQSYSVVIDPELGQDFFTLAPCRVLDTRNTAGPLGGPALMALADRIFPMAGSCGIPADAKSVSLNIAVTGPTNAGNLRLHPGGTSVPLVSSINYKAGQTRSNNAVIRLNALGELAAYLDQVSGTAHLILDVNGYFK